MQCVQSAPLWNTLEIAKLVLALATPILVAVGVAYITKSMHRLEARSLVNQKLVEKRLMLFDNMAPFLNDFYCYFMRVGGWKELTPPVLIERKRKLDKLFYTHKILFSPKFEADYFKFILDDCFRPFSGHAKNARLRTRHFQYSKLDGWKSDWTDWFVEDESDVCPPDRFAADYDALMNQFAAELGIKWS
jgi:hypothetical protein